MFGVIWSLVLLWNVATVATFGWDKWSSTRNGRRVRERTLLWMLFAAGWPGAWLAMSWFRHKTRKQPFRRYAILFTILNPFWALLYWTY
ncbi:MAG TPA: DUF1294 domain-containing protein [bacterium]|nr:DUF1294 domain-containing protein [bacterium]